MSLAGTLPINEEWSEKEIEEQKPVTHYISEILKNMLLKLHRVKLTIIFRGILSISELISLLKSKIIDLKN